MMALAEVGCRDQHLSRKELNTINTTAPDNIARWVVTLNAWRLANYQPMQGIDSRMSSASTRLAASGTFLTWRDSNKTRMEATARRRSREPTSIGGRATGGPSARIAKGARNRNL